VGGDGSTAAPAPAGRVTETVSGSGRGAGAPGPALAEGAVLGERYRVGRLLGAGGMGQVYEAHDVVLDQTVALKVLRPGAPAAQLAGLFEEVRLAQRVTHVNVCRTYDLEEVDGLWLIKMERLEGESLAACLRRRGPLPLAEALVVTRAALEGLAAAHAAGVVHGDLKPHNIMLAAGGRVVLMDFGVARAERASAGAISGTPLYAAPEQLAGGAIDKRADLFALGGVLHEMRGGRPPFPASTDWEAARGRMRSPAPDVRDARRGVPARVARAVARALAPDPAARFADAGAFAAALRPRPMRWRWLVAGAAALALVAGTAAVALAPGPAWRPEVRGFTDVFEENADDPVLSPDGRWLAYTSDRADRGGRGWRIYVEPADGGGEARALTPPGAFSPRWMHDGSALLYYDAGGDRVMRVAPDGGAPEVVAEFAYQADDCGARGVVILRHHLGRVTMTRLVGGAERELLRVPGAVPMARCDRAGERVVYSVRESGRTGDERAALWMVDVDTGSAVELLDDGHANLYPVFTADGRGVVFSSDREGVPQLHELSLASGRVRRLTAGDGPAMASDPSSDGRTLVYDVDRGSTQLYRVPLDGGVPRRLSQRLESVAHPSATPDGAEVVAQVRRGARSVVVAYAADGDGRERVVAEGLRPMVSPAGTLVFMRPEGDGSRLWAVPVTGGEASPLALVPGAPVLVGVDWEETAALVVDGAEGRVGVRVPLGGGPEERLPAPWLAILRLPGGWQLGSADDTLVVVAPGGSLDAPAARLPPGMFRPTADGRAVLYVANGDLRRYELESGRDEVVLAAAKLIFHNWTPSLEGDALFVVRTVGDVRRFRITNFDRRPRD
jgi:Tol biopolymer transport system component